MSIESGSGQIPESASDVMSHPLNLGNRYLNLAVIYIGEALTELGNVRQRGGAPGSDFINVQFALRRATFALQGKPYEPLPPDPKHSNAGAPR
jgi:hypothetical protein